MAVLATDTFTRANEAPLAGNWTSASGNSAFDLTSNQAVPHSSANDAWAYYNGVAWPNDQYSKATVTTGSTGGGSGPGVVVRQASAIATATRYRLEVSTAASQFEVDKSVAGAFTQIWFRTSAYTNGNPVQLEAQGTTIRAYNNGVQVGANATDSSIASGNAGIFYSSTQTGSAVDNWEGGDFSVGGGTIQPFLSLLGCGS